LVFHHAHTAQRMNRVSILPRGDGNRRFDVLTGQNGQKDHVSMRSTAKPSKTELTGLMKYNLLILPALVLALLFGLARQAQAQSGIVSFREGVNGYVGTLDTQLRSASPTTDTSAAVDLIADGSDGTPAGPAQIIIRFDNIFGGGPGQIPPGATIRKAELILYSTAGNAQSGGTFSLNRILQDWAETCTWGSCFGGDGMQQDDIESMSTADSTFIPNFPDPANNGVQSRTNNVTTSLQAWSLGQANLGWVIWEPPASTDGYRVNTSENATVANRPILLVEYGQCTAVTFTQPPANATVEQCRTATFSVQTTGSTPITYQWNKGGLPIDGNANPSALTSTLSLTNVQESDEGVYTVTALNECSNPTSAGATLTVTPDATPPTIVSAQFDVFDRTRLVITFSEPMEPGQALDYFNWTVDSTTPGGQALSVLAPGGTFTRPAGDQAAYVLDPPRNPGENYTVTVQNDMPDMCTFNTPGQQVLPLGTVVPITSPGVGFRQGAFYSGTQDTEIHGSAPDTVGGTSGGPDGTAITVDNDDAGGFMARGLLRFGDIFGSDPGQIPFGATISNATLTVSTDDAGSNPILIFRMLVDWNEATTTWNSLGNGIDDGTNGTEAVFFGTLNPTPDEALDTIDVTALVQLWADGAPNYGWAFVATGGDGWDYDTSESGTEANRPSLLITYSFEPTACRILDQPDSVTVNECSGFTLSVAAEGTGLTYQWQKGGVDIPGATSASYTVAAAHPSQHNGSYRVVVSSTVPPSPCTSDPATVTVTPDTTKPTVVSALGTTDQTRITVTFADQCPINQADAQNVANYTVGGTPGVAVTSAVLNGMTVTLTTAARVPPNSYSLTVRNIRDTSDAQNMMNTITISPLLQHVQLSARDHTWKYLNNGANLDSVQWAAEAYDDSLWLSGQALLGFEDTAGTRTALFNQGWNTNNLFLLSRTNTVGGGLNGTNVTDFFRTTVNVPFSLASAVIEIRHAIDDGAVFYFNGAEVGRFNMPPAPNKDGFLTNALAAAGEGVTRSLSGLSGLRTGNNTIAVSVHQNVFSSSDIVFGAQLIAIYGAVPPTLHIENLGGNSVRVSWSPNSGVLQQSTDLTTWTTAASQANPQTHTATGALFYRIAP
jgi:immunoglobulin I-set domain protein